MKMKFKKTLSLILAVLMVMTAVPFSGMAADCDHTYKYVQIPGANAHWYACSKCGFVENYGTTAACSGGTATCATKANCEICESPYGPTLEHSFTAEDIDEKFYVAGTGDCETVKKYYVNCANEGCDEKGTVTFDGTAYGAHVFTEYSAKGDATCTDPGHKVATCDVCGVETHEIDGEESDKLGHNYVDAVVEANKISDATCTVGGIYYKSCEHCGAKSTETFTTDTIPHSFAETDKDFALIKSAATCTKKAVYYMNCSVCRTTSKNIDETATFEYGEPHAKPTTSAGVAKPTAAEEASCLRKNATCEDDAIYSLVCNICREPMIAAGTDMGADIPIKEHIDFYVKEGTALNPDHSNLKKDMKKSSDAVEATCTKSGMTEIYECTVDGCGAKVGGAEIPAKGHKYDEAKTKKYTPASCSKDGTYGYKYCAECKGEFYFNEKGEEITQTETVLKPLKQFGHTDDDQDHICDTCNAEVTAQDTCKCICHSGGIMYFIVLILKFIWRTTGAKPTCPAPCGQAHY